ncbi:co-chaperone GroES [bacterium]|nr:co-chaperone GroES [bacterium]|tara:strand:- start:21303 stop:21611 length:309 start_codon:yes stop_codon:yes gene_type:complete
MSSTNIKPLGDRVVVAPIDPADNAKKTKGGIIIPETVNKERPEKGKVVSIGPGKYDDNGNLIPVSVKKGQTVLFSKYGPDEVKIDGKEYFILNESNILAVIE